MNLLEPPLNIDVLKLLFYYDELTRCRLLKLAYYCKTIPIQNRNVPMDSFITQYATNPKNIDSICVRFMESFFSDSQYDNNVVKKSHYHDNDPRRASNYNFKSYHLNDLKILYEYSEKCRNQLICLVHADLNIPVLNHQDVTVEEFVKMKPNFMMIDYAFEKLNLINNYSNYFC